MTLNEFFISLGSVCNGIDEYSKKLLQLIDNASTMWTTVQSKISSWDWETISRALVSLQFITKLETIGFPPCIHLDEVDMKEILNLFTDINNSQPINAIISKYDAVLESVIIKEWEMMVIDSDNLLHILREAINDYNEGKYFSCTALLVCQYGNIINENDKTLQLLANCDDDIRNRIEFLKDEQIDIIAKKTNSIDKEKINLDSERNRIFRHLDIYRNLETLFFLDYFDRFVYGNKYQGNHPNRNAICHGYKKDFGNQETALKAILCMDILLRCPQIFDKISC